MINTTYITETISTTVSTAIDIFGLFVKSALLIDVTPNIHYTFSKKDPLWHNITNNDNPPPPDDDAPGILREEYKVGEGETSVAQILRNGNIEPCFDNDGPPLHLLNNMLILDVVNDGLTHPPALLGSLPISQ